MVMSGRSVDLFTLFRGRLRPPKPFTSTKRILSPSPEGKTGERKWPDRVSSPGLLLNQTRYRLHYTAPHEYTLRKECAPL